MGLAVGDIVAITYGATADAQQIRYNLHYKVTTAGSSTTPELDLQAFADNMAGGANALLVALRDVHADTQFNFDFCSAQRVWPTRTIRLVKLFSQSGTVPVPPFPPNLSVVISKRTLTPGRMGLGSLHLSGVPQSFITAGEVDAGHVPDYNPLISELSAARTISAVTMSVEPGLFNPSFPPTFFSRLFDCQLQITSRVMRRRTLRVGI